MKHDWDIVRCPVCSLTFVNPLPSQEVITSYYNGMYSTLASEYNEDKMNWARRSVEGYIKSIDKMGGVSQKTLLDLGGGLGYYAKAFEEKGFDVTLVEMDPVSANFAREVLDIEQVVEEDFVEYLLNSKQRCDVVFLRHVIEHAPAPQTLIAKIADYLPENGLLIIETDNNAGIELLFKPGTTKFYKDLYRSAFQPSSIGALLKSRPFALDPPRHLYGFRIYNLSKLLLRHSLTPVKTICYRLGHPVYWPNVYTPSIKDALSNLVHKRLKNFLTNALDITLIPFRYLLQMLGLASGICIYARKNSAT